VVPVYIPNREDYFESALEVFRISLASLLATVDAARTAITIIDNASLDEVASLVMPAVLDGRIDRYVRSSVNRGKSDPVVAELRGAYEPFVTIADADVLFLHGWQGETERVFRAFPDALAVSPSPAPNLIHYACASTWLQAVLRGRLRLGNEVDGNDLDQFEASVGKAIFDPECRRDQFMLAGRGGERALLGAGHFVISFRRECFSGFRYQPTLEGTGIGDRMVDEHVDRLGGLRLATSTALVKHMGNVPEAWMRERLAEVQSEAARTLAGEDIPWRSGVAMRLLAASPDFVRRRSAWLLRAMAVAWRRWRQRRNARS